MGGDHRQAMRSTYLNLAAGELAAVAAFIVVAVNAIAPRLDGSSRVALWCALVPLLVVLVQGGAYWLLARRWVLHSPMPASLAALYRGFRRYDVAMLAAGLVGVLTHLPDSAGASVLVVAIWLFAVVEYANYFVVRLAYPVRRWLTTVGQWRTPRLVLDLRAATTGW